MTTMLSYWTQFALNNGAAWYLTYLIYSTGILGVTFLLIRITRVSSRAEHMAWRVALVVAPVAVTLRVATEHMSRQPMTGPDILTISGTTGWVIIGCWIVSLLLAAKFASRMAATAWTERQTLRERLPVRHGTATDELTHLTRVSGFRVPILTESDALQSPVAIGTSEICLPVGMPNTLDRSGVRAVLAHEIAHLRDNHARWSFYAQLMERLMFFQPLHRLLSRRIKETAEFVADDYAVQACGNPEHLVDALTAFARRSQPGTAFIGGTGESLLIRRVRRVLQAPTPRREIPVATSFLGFAVLTGLIWFAPAVVPALDCRLIL